MANNRLYILDPETGETFMLAKSGASGWNVWDPGLDMGDRLEEWLELRDQGASFSQCDEPTALRLVDENHMNVEHEALSDGTFLPALEDHAPDPAPGDEGEPLAP